MSKHDDLSPAAIRRAVLGRSLQHPSVVYPALAGVLGGMGAAVVASSPLVIGAAVAAGVVALSAFGTNFFLRHDKIAGSYLEATRKRLAEHRQAQIADLAEDLREVKSADGERQLKRFVEKITTFQAVLAERLQPSELTFARFSAIAEAVFLAGVDNLRDIHLALKALEAVDETYVSNRLKTLPKSASSAPDAQTQGLRDQLEHGKNLRERVQARLGENEQAMAELDRATAAVSDMKTGANRATLEMAPAMQELARLAERSARY